MDETELEAATFERTIEHLESRGDIAALVRGMKTYAAHTSIQEKGCDVLLNLTPSVGDEYQSIRRQKIPWKGMGEKYEAMASAGVIGVVCHAISTTPTIAATGCRLLKLLARNDDNSIKIAEQGGISVILEAMRTHTSHAGVQEEGCGALRNLAVNAGNKIKINFFKLIKITEQGGIEVILKAMRTHTSDAGVQGQGCGALTNLARNDDNQIKIAQQDGIYVILEAMRNHTSDAVVQAEGCNALRVLANKIAEQGCIEVIL